MIVNKSWYIVHKHLYFNTLIELEKKIDKSYKIIRARKIYSDDQKRMLNEQHHLENDSIKYTHDINKNSLMNDKWYQINNMYHSTNR